MACDKRKETGTCGHHQCEHAGDTDHDECVTILGHFCEKGLNCVEECSYSWTDKDKARVGAAIDHFLRGGSVEKKAINKADWSGDKTEIIIFERDGFPNRAVLIPDLESYGLFILKPMPNNDDLYTGYYITNPHWSDPLGSVAQFRGDKEWVSTACGIVRESECALTAVAQLLLNTI